MSTRAQNGIIKLVSNFRLYDTRSNQRRPVHDLLWQDEALTSMAATGNPDQVKFANLSFSHQAAHIQPSNTVSFVKSLIPRQQLNEKSNFILAFEIFNTCDPIKLGQFA